MAGPAPAARGGGSDTRARFLREIGERLPRERVSELHLFPPMRHGGTETGVAVIAVAPAFTDVEVGAGAPAPESPTRHTVYTATYRHTLKGPERGKWEVALQPEADAPLLSLDAVVRGVQRRAGDEGAMERIHGDELAQLLAPAS
jgi:hypothetical protein